MPYISLGEKDRARLGVVDEWLEFHPGDITIRDLGELADRFDFDHMDWPEPFFGEVPFDRAGGPDARPVAPRWQLQATVWMGLRQNNFPVSWDELGDVQAGWVRIRAEKPGESSGKDDAATPARRSRKPASSTTRRSSTSGPASPPTS